MRRQGASLCSVKEMTVCGARMIFLSFCFVSKIEKGIFAALINFLYYLIFTN